MSTSPTSSGTMPAHTPLVTVLVTCYNYGRFLNQCIDSVLSQDGVEIQVIIIDDASTDDSPQIAAALAKRDPRIRLILLARNLGMIPAVNVGLQHVEGDYFVKLDADDMLSPGSLQRSVKLLEQYPNVGFVYGWPRHFTGGAPRCQSTGHRRWTVGALIEWLVTRSSPSHTVWRGLDWLALRYQRGHNCIRQPEAVIRTSVLRRVGEYNPCLPHTSDLEMWLRLAKTSDVGRINRIDQGYYRVHPASMQHTVNAGLLTDLVGRRGAFLSEALTPRELSSNGDNLEDVIRKELAVQALGGACAALDAEGAQGGSVDKLVEFAADTFPAVVSLPHWRTVERRRRRKWFSRWSPAARVASTTRYFRHEFEYFRWMRTGV